MEYLNLKDKVAVITGGGGIICSTLAKALAQHGVKTVILDHKPEACEIAEEIEKEFNTPSMGVCASVLDKESLESAMKINSCQVRSY